MAYTASNILGADSPALGASKATYTAEFDDAFQAIDEHDHSTGKGVAIPNSGLATSIRAVSSTCTVYTAIALAAAADITNLSRTFTSTGRPARIKMIPASGGTSRITCQGSGYFYLYKDGAYTGLSIRVGSSSSVVSNYFPPGVVEFVDPSPDPGVHTYKLQLECDLGIAVSLTYAALEVSEYL